MAQQVQRLNSLCTIGLLMLGLLAVAGAGDPWTFFHPETVKSFGCKVTDTEISYDGIARGNMVWQATAFANREHDNWSMEVAVYPHTLKGRHAAEKACMKWQDEAEKRVYGAQGK